ncbi:Serine phosphatase RsbU, regulator of sigma subunit [Sphingomonas laterariae]|uniref:Serine phosphatase RsbU, regulator of sigma subunit n=1 Tax=Edaphosphingomonas laterariae TaxID=861865 RepID=A0A239E0S5_9SPHN|nr:CHASE2 domain-containing protein [Sphingomonas laterariae]SNS38207.1 Serine phosphatase RsbU, regulator of sigma subunit [Sphingomonas laterariae]
MTGSKSRSDPVSAEARSPLGRARAIGLAAALAMLALIQLAGPGISERLFDSYQRWAPARPAKALAHVVLIDPESLASIGPWPWPRYTIARLTERLAQGGAAAIGFDVTFPEPDRYNPDQLAALYPELAGPARDSLMALPSMDAVFAEVIGRNPVVLARAGLVAGSTDYEVAAATDAALLPVEAQFTAPLPPGVGSFDRALSNIVDLDDVAAGHGLINGTPDGDGTVRRVLMVANVGGVPTPGFALELARVGQGIATIRPVIADGGLSGVGLGDTYVPVAPDGRMRLHFGPMPEKSVTPAHLVLKRGLAPGRFRGKFVLVGLAAAGTADVVTTPIEDETYGVYVQARTVNAILSGDALIRPRLATWGESALGLALALVSLWLLPRLRLPWAAILPVGLALALLAGSWIAFRGHGLLFDPIRPIAIAGAAGVGLLAALFVEAVMARQRLAAALDVERLNAAKAAGELDAARDIQLGMLPPVDRMTRLHPAIDLDGLLEPARTVGGDFFDAMRIDDRRICFLVGDVTGKGVPAALFMALSKALARSALRRGPADLGAAMTGLNDEISRDNGQDMFVTMLVGIIDATTGEVLLCNAGHENPILVHADGRAREVPLEGGPPLCAVDAYPYMAEPIRLAPGDGLVIVTDGISEAQSPDGDFFGHPRINAALASWTADRPAGDAGTALLRAVRRFEAGGEPSDDLTVLALRFRGG